MEPAPPNEQPRAGSTPVMDVVPPKPPEALKEPPKDNTGESVELKPSKTAVTKPPKRPSSGVGLAIFATVIIVIALAALMVYAYLRTNQIKVF
jgi:hypothetical protein